MPYRPVSTTDRLCQHCQTVFQAKDKRRMYCSSSCNTLACQARKTTKPANSTLLPSRAEEAERSLPLSMETVTTLAAGASVVAGLNYLANDRPAHAEVMAALHEIKALLEKLTAPAKADQTLDYIVSYIDAQRGVDPGLSERMRQAHQQRQQQQKHKAQVGQDIKDRLLTNRKRRPS